MPSFNASNLQIDISQRKLKRYEWEDRLIWLHKIGYISSRTLNTCLRLSSVMNWKVGGELRWDNDSAFLESGVGRSTFYKQRYEALASGVLSKKSNNYIASIPSTKQLYDYEEQVNDRIAKKFENNTKKADAITLKKQARKNWLKETQESQVDNY